MPNVLIYSPDFDGHRQVYVYVCTYLLKELGFKIFVAGDINRVITNSTFLDKLKNDPALTIKDTGKYPGGGMNIGTSDFIELQNACQTDLTIFIEADNYISMLSSQVFRKNRLRGKLVGFFIRPSYYYARESLYERLRRIKNLPKTWREDESLFHEILLKWFSLLDVSLCIDEKFVDSHSSMKWMPDMYQQFVELLVKDEKSEERVWIERLNEFREKNKGRFFFFYFGTSQPRRGYDTLLKMAEDKDGCFIHCGLRNEKEKFNFDVDQLRTSLNKSGRLFETNQYISDPICIESFFKSVSHLILPYRNFSNSSGVMIQALGYGIPVLAPSYGLIGYRIKKYRLGATYNSKEDDSLYSEFEKFIKSDVKIFEDNIKTYMGYQSVEKLKEVLIDSFRLNG
jgi:glycosyltransferase involved in cell wall biosynthesis